MVIAREVVSNRKRKKMGGWGGSLGYKHKTAVWMNVLFSNDVFPWLGVFFRTFIVVLGLENLLCIISLDHFRRKSSWFFSQ